MNRKRFFVWAFIAAIGLSIGAAAKPAPAARPNLWEATAHASSTCADPDHYTVTATASDYQQSTSIKWVVESYSGTGTFAFSGNSASGGVTVIWREYKKISGNWIKQTGNGSTNDGESPYHWSVNKPHGCAPTNTPVPTATSTSLPTATNTPEPKKYCVNGVEKMIAWNEEVPEGAVLGSCPATSTPLPQQYCSGGQTIEVAWNETPPDGATLGACVIPTATNTSEATVTTDPCVTNPDSCVTPTEVTPTEAGCDTGYHKNTDNQCVPDDTPVPGDTPTTDPCVANPDSCKTPEVTPQTPVPTNPPPSSSVSTAGGSDLITVGEYIILGLSPFGAAFGIDFLKRRRKNSSTKS